ncbi:MAG: hypothetical protein N4A43_04285 [Alphaproteobacteria bacterium]|jgi:ribosome maturation protein Sdo1|nr:hypothetical protein [Alphaproteobacteria bacterium]
MNSDMTCDVETLLKMASNCNYIDAAIEGVKAVDLEENPEAIVAMVEVVKYSNSSNRLNNVIKHKILESAKNGNKASKEALSKIFSDNNGRVARPTIGKFYDTLKTTEDRRAFLSCFMG